MEIAFLLLVLVVTLTLIFDFINGFHDAANAIATVVATKVLSPRTAVIMAAVLNFSGALLGTAVAATIGQGLVEQKIVTLEIIICALVGAIVWNLITWYKGLPSSSSYALIGALMGAVYFATDDGQKNIMWDAVMQKVVEPMFASPVIGFFLGFLVMFLLMWLVCRMSNFRINAIFSKLQIVSAGVMALSHGHNDAQKAMGIIALALVTYNPTNEFEVPLWVILSCAAAMGLGTMMGGWRIIRTLGTKMITLRPIHGFAAETTAATIIIGASQFGIPVSTTQIISTSIMGVGATKRFSALRWRIISHILWAWILTVPATFLIAGGLVPLAHSF